MVGPSNWTWSHRGNAELLEMPPELEEGKENTPHSPSHLPIFCHQHLLLVEAHLRACDIQTAGVSYLSKTPYSAPYDPPLQRGREKGNLRRASKPRIGKPTLVSLCVLKSIGRERKRRD